MAGPRQPPRTFNRATSPAITKRIGSSGLIESGGVLNEEFVEDLRGVKGVRTIKRMRVDPIIAAGLHGLKLPMFQVAWYWDPASEDPADQTRAQFVRECWQDMTAPAWGIALTHAATFLEWGFAPLEIVYKIRNGRQTDREASSAFSDGMIGWAGFQLRSQDSVSRWIFDKDTRRLTAMIQQDSTIWKPATIPIERLLNFRALQYKDSPQGESVLRGAFEPWKYRTETVRFEGIGIERDLAGMPHILVPSEIMADDATTDQKATLEHYRTVGTNVRRNRQGVIITPSDRDPTSGQLLYEFKLVTSGGTRQHDTLAVTKQRNLEIALAMLSDTMLIGHEGTGSLALHSSKTNIAGLALGAFLDSIADEVNTRAVPELVAFNPTLPAGRDPILRHADVETADLALLAQYIGALQAAGLDLTDEETEAWLRRQAGMPLLRRGDAT